MVIKTIIFLVALGRMRTVREAIEVEQKWHPCSVHSVVQGTLLAHNRERTRAVTASKVCIRNQTKANP